MTQVNAGGGDSPAKLFRGYDSISRGMLNDRAVDGGNERTGGPSVVTIQVCESLSELADALEIDGSLSVGYLKALNVTAKMNFMQSLKVTTRSTTIVVYASHVSGVWTAKEVKLAKEIAAPVDDDEAADFAAAYGDSYVSSVTEGGEYYGVYTFHTETQTEQKDLTASLKSEGIFGGVTANLDLQTKLSKFLSKTSINWTFKQEITGLANPALPSQEKLIEFAIAFSEKKLDAAVTTNFQIAGYEGVKAIGRRKFAKIVENRDHFLGDDGVLHSLARLTGIQNQISWLNRIYDRYGFTGDDTLLAFEQQVKQDLATINKQVTAYKRDPAADFVVPSLPSLAKGEPVLAFSVGAEPSWGRAGGEPFDFQSVSEALRNQVRITSIRLFEGSFKAFDVIRRLEVDYASDKTKWSQSRGQGGNPKELLRLEEGQFPVTFKVRAGDLIDRIEVHLSDGRWTGAGGYKAGEQIWNVPDGGVVLGFSGRSGETLDEFRIVHAKLLKANYKKT